MEDVGKYFIHRAYGHGCYLQGMKISDTEQLSSGENRSLARIENRRPRGVQRFKFNPLLVIAGEISLGWFVRGTPENFMGKSMVFEACPLNQSGSSLKNGHDRSSSPKESTYWE